jgi:hypothetical protein
LRNSISTCVAFSFFRRRRICYPSEAGPGRVLSGLRSRIRVALRSLLPVGRWKVGHRSYKRQNSALVMPRLIVSIFLVFATVIIVASRKAFIGSLIAPNCNTSIGIRNVILTKLVTCHRHRQSVADIGEHTEEMHRQPHLCRYSAISAVCSTAFCSRQSDSMVSPRSWAKRLGIVIVSLERSISSCQLVLMNNPADLETFLQDTTRRPDDQKLRDWSRHLIHGVPKSRRIAGFDFPPHNQLGAPILKLECHHMSVGFEHIHSLRQIGQQRWRNGRCVRPRRMPLLGPEARD